MSMFATKSIEQLKAEAAATGEHSLKRVLGATNLVTLGIGAIIGTGIFVLTGQAAAAVRRPCHRPRRWFSRALRAALAGLVLRGVCVDCTRSPAPPTRTATPRWASSSPGSSAGT